MSAHDKDQPSAEAMAAKWMAARDRGFTPAEQDAYLQWLSEDPIHGAEIARLSRAWNRLDALHQWNPTHSVQPNADLLLPRHRNRWLRRTVAYAAAAVFVFAATLISLQSGAFSEDPAGVIMHPSPRRLTLNDGSRVELNHDARIEVHFTAETRAIHLTHGEAHFIVAKNPDRPFVVTAGQTTVRAVGTAFNVALAPEEIAVLVTEGIVQLGAPTTAALPVTAFPRVGAGQQALIRRGAESDIRVVELTPAQIEAQLEWQSLRLEFNAVPLRDVVAEFNRYNSRQLVVADDATAEIVIGGTFRADNVEAFVRLLDVGFNVSVEVQDENLVLTRRAD